jgi:hypothetical protein
MVLKHHLVYKDLEFGYADFKYIRSNFLFLALAPSIKMGYFVVKIN